MIEINIDLKKLCALNLLAAEPQQMRPHLCGVYVQATPTQTRLAATSGIVAGALANANPLDTNTGVTDPVSFIIPSDVIARLKPGKELAPVCTVLIETEDANAYTLRLWDGTRIPFTPLPGQFPDLQRIVPTGAASGEACNIDATLLALFMKVNKLMTGTKEPGKMELGHRGVSSAVTVKFLHEPGFVGVLMPLDPKKGFDTHHTVSRWE